MRNPSRSWRGPPNFLLRETELEAVHESGFGIVSYLSAEWNARFIPDKIKEIGIKEINTETPSLAFLFHSSQLKEGI